MDERDKHPMEEDVQPGVLQLGLFVTISTSRRGGTGFARVSVVPRRGATVVVGDWRWSPTSMPLEILQAIATVIDAALVEAVERTLGVQEALPL